MDKAEAEKKYGFNSIKEVWSQATHSELLTSMTLTLRLVVELTVITLLK